LIIGLVLSRHNREGKMAQSMGSEKSAV